MELSAIKHITSRELNNYQPDLYITSVNHESRGTNIARIMEPLACRKVAFEHPTLSKDFSYSENLEYFASQQFEIIPLNDETEDFKPILSEIRGAQIRVAVDYTGMPQSWYYQVLNWFGEEAGHIEGTTLRFAYTMAGYSDRPSSPRIRTIRDLTPSEERRRKKRKTALIMGLGHEEKIYESIYRQAKPDLLYLFYADPPVDKRFVEKVFVNNHALINATPIRNLVAYPIRNGQQIYQELIDTILPLRRDYRVRIIPMGPKIFSLAAMLIHLGYPDISIGYPEFRKGKNQITDSESFGNPVVTDVYLEGEE